MPRAVELFVCAGFYERLDRRLVAPAQTIAHGIRTGVCVNDEHPWVDKIVRDAAKNFETAIVIVGGWDWRNADGAARQEKDANLLDAPGKEHLASQCRSVAAVWRQSGRDPKRLLITIGNELDGSYWLRNLDGFHELALHCYESLRSFAAGQYVRFVAGSVSNLNTGGEGNGYDYLRSLCRLDWAPDVEVGLHPYRTKCRQDEWPSWSSTDEALAKLDEALNGRKVIIDEMGWHSGGSFSDEEIAQFTRDEIAMWQSRGVDAYGAYQLQDGPQPHGSTEDAFGCYRNLADGLSPKPIVPVLSRFRG